MARSSTAWATSTEWPAAASDTVSCVRQPMFADTTTVAPEAATESALRRPSAAARAGCSTL